MVRKIGVSVTVVMLVLALGASVAGPTHALVPTQSGELFWQAPQPLGVDLDDVDLAVR
jgi:hypothetical protein